MQLHKLILWLSYVCDRHAARTHRSAYRLRELYNRLHMRAILRGSRSAGDTAALILILLAPVALSLLFFLL